MNERIREIRKYYGLTQQEFADKISVTRSAMCKLESGENNLSRQTLHIICSEFNVREDWLKTGQGNMIVNDNYPESTQGERVKVLRKRLGLSQAVFATGIRLSRNFVAQVETGKKTLSERSIYYLCEYYNVNRVWFETGEGSMFNESSEQDTEDNTIKQNTRLYQLLEIITTMSEKQINQLADIALILKR